MADVAERAGVSVSTVSHVLNGTRTVADATRQRVLRSIEDLAYVPNQVARSLVRSSSRQLGLAISIGPTSYFGDLVHAIDTAARTAGYLLMLANTEEAAAQERVVVEALQAHRVEGLLLVPGGGAAATLDRLAAGSTPVVLVDRRPDDRFDAVASEGADTTRRLTEHLLAAGHERIGMLSGLAGLTTTDDRIAGYRSAMTAAGFDPDTYLVSGASDTHVAAQAVTELLERSPRPTAVVIANNAMVIGATLALRRLGVRVPDDLAIVAYDDFEWSDAFVPRLTTAAQDIATIGRVAVELLLERVAGTDRPPRYDLIEPVIRHRDSCGCGDPAAVI